MPRMCSVSSFASSFDLGLGFDVILAGAPLRSKERKRGFRPAASMNLSHRGRL